MTSKEKIIEGYLVIQKTRMKHSKSEKKYIRNQKAQIRRQSCDVKKQDELIKAMYNKLNPVKA